MIIENSSSGGVVRAGRIYAVSLLLVLSLMISTWSVTSAPVAQPDAAQITFAAGPYQWTGNEWPQSGSPVLTNVPLYTYTVTNVWPHDRGAFTEGFVFKDGFLLEGTGLLGQSSLREVDLHNGKVLKQVNLAPQYFGEGITVLSNKVYELTWVHHLGFVYDLDTFRRETNFSYAGEGWGLTTDGQWLILGDGTPRLRFIDPRTFEVNRTITVTSHGQPVKALNELEYVNGEIFANIWQTDYVVRIDPATGEVLGLIDFSGLLPAADRDANTDVLNGIAYDAVANRLFVTGKRWPKIFEVQLKVK